MGSLLGVRSLEMSRRVTVEHSEICRERIEGPVKQGKKLTECLEVVEERRIRFMAERIDKKETKRLWMEEGPSAGSNGVHDAPSASVGVSGAGQSGSRASSQKGV